nr:arginase family protein [Microbacterium yannicii]
MSRGRRAPHDIGAPSSASVHLLVAPYDSGRFDERMGAGPRALQIAGAARVLRESGHNVLEVELEPISEWRSELATAFELHRVIAEATSTARRSGAFPLLLAGNCNATVGALAGLTATCERVGLIWMDAHGDFNSPDEDGAGFLDGQGLAMAVGRCWHAATSRIPGFRPLPEEDVVLVGVRDLTDAQRTVLGESGLSVFGPSCSDAGELRAAVRALAERVDVVHLHVDLDVLDPSIAPANQYAAPGGLSAGDVRDVIGLASDFVRIGSATVASYDPSFDPHGALGRAALTLLGFIVDRARHSRRLIADDSPQL